MVFMPLELSLSSKGKLPIQTCPKVGWTCVAFPCSAPRPCTLHRLSSVLTAVFVILYSNLATAQPLPNPSNTSRWRFFAREPSNAHNKITGAQGCPLEGCHTRTEIPGHSDSISTAPALSSSFFTKKQVTACRRPPYMEVADVRDAKLNPPVMMASFLPTFPPGQPPQPLGAMATTRLPQPGLLPTLIVSFPLEIPGTNDGE